VGTGVMVGVDMEGAMGVNVGSGVEVGTGGASSWHASSQDAKMARLGILPAWFLMFAVPPRARSFVPPAEAGPQAWQNTYGFPPRFIDGHDARCAPAPPCTHIVSRRVAGAIHLAGSVPCGGTHGHSRVGGKATRCGAHDQLYSCRGEDAPSGSSAESSAHGRIGTDGT